ncbi:MAG: CvpA family protein [Pseudomonadota bacterium]|nr:CvpA family protein [Pseudomonadota bacterium]
MSFDFSSFPINGADLTFTVILLLSGVLAFFRGAVREVLAIGGWVAAVAVSYYGFEYVKPYTLSVINVPMVADAVTSIGLFVVTMVTMAIVNGVISKRVQTSSLDTLDSSLGFVFGLARGALIICIAYLVMVIFVPPEEQPITVHEARSLPLIEIGAGWLVMAVPEEKREEWALSVRSAKTFAAKAMENRNALDVLMSAPPVAGGTATEGYSDAERTDMERLIESNQ